MENRKMSKTTLILLVSGLLLVSMVPLISRYVAIPDFGKGFLTGIGIVLELTALVKARMDKKACDRS